MKAIHRIIIVIVVFLLIGLMTKIFSNPDKAEIEKIVIDLLENPKQCEKIYPDTFQRISQLNWRSSEMRLKIKLSALPKRVDYYLIDPNGNIVAEIVYRVNAKCDGIYVEKVNSGVLP